MESGGAGARWRRRGGVGGALHIFTRRCRAARGRAATMRA